MTIYRVNIQTRLFAGDNQVIKYDRIFSTLEAAVEAAGDALQNDRVLSVELEAMHADIWGEFEGMAIYDITNMEDLQNAIDAEEVRA